MKRNSGNPCVHMEGGSLESALGLLRLGKHQLG